MITTDYLVRCALANAHRTVGRAFCVALGILHLAGKAHGLIVCDIDAGAASCFENRIDPRDARFRKGA